MSCTLLLMQCHSVPYTGEFGIVYKAYIVKNKDGQIVMETMAVKTLKGELDTHVQKLRLPPAQVFMTRGL